MEAGTSQTQTSVFESPAGLLPLVSVREQASGFAEGALDFFVKLSQRCLVEVGGYHSHVVSDFADSGAVPQETEGDLGSSMQEIWCKRCAAFSTFPRV